MAYNVYFSCDSCGATYNWVNHAGARMDGGDEGE